MITISAISPLAALIAGILILIIPRILNYVVAVYLILIGLIGIMARYRNYGPIEVREGHSQEISGRLVDAGDLAGQPGHQRGDTALTGQSEEATDMTNTLDLSVEQDKRGGGTSDATSNAACSTDRCAESRAGDCARGRPVDHRQDERHGQHRHREGEGGRHYRHAKNERDHKE